MKTMGKGWLSKKQILVLCIFILLGAVAGITSWQNATRESGQGLKRAGPGAEEEEHTYYYKVDGGEKKELTFSLHARTLTESEVLKVLDAAEHEWDSLYLGNNKSVQNVSDDLVLPDTLQDGLVAAEYTFDSLEAIDTDGKIHPEALSAEGQAVTLTAVLTCEGQEQIAVRYLHLKAPAYSKEQKEAQTVAEAVNEKEAATRQTTYFNLPQKAGGHTITWMAKPDRSWIMFPLLGVVVAAALGMREKEQEARAQKDRAKKMMLAYPALLDQLSLLAGSGMTVRRALETIVRTERLLKERGLSSAANTPVIEELQITLREIREGKGEAAAYEEFGRRIGLRPYRKLASILSQNLMHGSRDIRTLLETEAAEAMEQRRHTARRLGETAGTRMLGPMLLMFVVILAMVLLPAALQFI